jgi:membrane-anchored glycerophosphoryl diester phosphodiesterase (GDPDase)
MITKKKTMKIERIVQLLFYLLVIVGVIGISSYNSEPIISHAIRNILIVAILILMTGFIIYYYIPKKKS